MIRAFIASSIVGLTLMACSSSPSDLTGGPGGDNPSTDPSNPNPTPSPTTTATPVTPDACAAATHIGFGGTDFVADRKIGDIGLNRRRVKPYSMLANEYKRALGADPLALATSVAAYGDVPARWFIEPDIGAVADYTTYTLAFQACYDSLTAATYQAMPTATTGPTECASLQLKYWQRTATPDEVTACSDLMVTGLTTETNARRRWAHGCASIITATGFTTY